jgi:iron(II)-dependent oxidoreductase
VDSPVTPVTQASTVAAIPTPVKQTPGGHPIYTFGGMDFVKIPAADFFMGADDIENASPQHLVYQLNYDFYMGRFPVTNLQYSRYMRELGQPVLLKKEKADHPVVNVSWRDAQSYIAWMNKKYVGELPKGFVFRLPSEAEWERAARGTNGNEYPWGNSFDKSRCNSEKNEASGITPVDKYSPSGDSPEGCADMTGNVWEWTRSLWGENYNKPTFKYPYRFDDRREDENAADSVARVLRGGAFDYSDGNWGRCALRLKILPSEAYDTVGIRVAVMLQ